MDQSKLSAVDKKHLHDRPRRSGVIRTFTPEELKQVDYHKYRYDPFFTRFTIEVKLCDLEIRPNSNPKYKSYPTLFGIGLIPGTMVGLFLKMNAGIDIVMNTLRILLKKLDGKLLRTGISEYRSIGDLTYEFASKAAEI